MIYNMVRADIFVQYHNFSLNCCMSGFKPGQRKVVFTCLKRNLMKEIKVAQLAGSVAEHSAYHHGEVSAGIELLVMLLLMLC